MRSISECKALNGTLSECGSACLQSACVKEPEMACTAVCIKGCFCAEGYVRELSGACGPITKVADKCGRCILKADCPQSA